MPFKLKLKRSRQYNVVSKSLFVICIELLDGANVECTLSSESLGRECLEHVCQRLVINQSEFFGLRFAVRHGGYRWVDMDRPLKRQLDKHSTSKSLYLRVMYYVLSGVSLITDENTRYHYFLQLKNDVIEGKIVCNFKQAVLLASYSRQAEYGNHDTERHTVDYLKKLLSFPKHFIENGKLEALTEAVIREHASLHNMSQGVSEEYYIAACQQLDGYGQETFLAQDDNSKEIVLGLSVSGIIVCSDQNQTSKQYRWIDISNVINQKRSFTIECIDSQRTVTFHLADVDSAKYVWRLCVLKHTFYMQYEQYRQSQAPSEHPNPTAKQIQEETNLFNVNETREIGIRNEIWNDLGKGSSISLTPKVQSTSCLDLTANTDEKTSDRLRSMLPSYRPAPDYETAVLQKYRPSVPEMMSGIVYGSQPEIHRPASDTQHGYYNPVHYPDVTNHTSQRTLYGNPVDAYGNAGHFAQIETYGNGVVDGLVSGMKLLHLYKPPPPYPTSRLNSNSTPDLAAASQIMNTPSHNFINNVSGSSPDLVSNRSVLNQPYFNQYISAPSVQTSEQVPAIYMSKPNLRGTYENLSSFIDNSSFNKNRIMDNSITNHIQKVYDDRGNVIYCMPRHIEHIVENRINRINVKPVHVHSDTSLFTNPQLPDNSNTVLNGLEEPIYENVPLPWQNDSSEMRNRTHSVQSAPGLIRFMDKKDSQTLFSEDSPIYQQRSNETNQGKEENLTDLLKLESYTNSDIKTINPFKDESQIAMRHNESNSENDLVTRISNLNDTSSNSTLNELYKVKGNSVKNVSETRLDRGSPLDRFNMNFNLVKSQTLQPSTTQDSVYIDDTLNNTDSNVDNVKISSNSNKEKKKRRWILLGGRSKSSDKFKSATLGRERDSNKAGSKEGNSRHRWSTGLPRLQPLPPTISKEALCQVLQTKLSDTQLFYEFEHIEPSKKKSTVVFQTALDPDNFGRNKQLDFLPYEENRVRISPSKDNRSGYINASHITASVGLKQLFYICAESPSQQSIESFLQCVWEADVYLIVQLSDKTDCQYLPESSDRCLEFGQYQVWRQYSLDNEQCITSKLRIYQLNSRSYRAIWHLQYTQWTSQGCPKEVGHYLGFLEELSSVRHHSILEVPIGHNRNPPVLVHCPTGGIRSGLTIASHLLLYTLDHNQELDIPRIIGLLRQQRANLLSSVVQYKFLYTLIIYYLQQTRLI